MSQANYKLSYQCGKTVILERQDGTIGGARISDQAPLRASRAVALPG